MVAGFFGPVRSALSIHRREYRIGGVSKTVTSLKVRTKIFGEQRRHQFYNGKETRISRIATDRFCRVIEDGGQDFVLIRVLM